MLVAMRHPLIWAVVLACLAACGGGEGDGVVDGFAVANGAGNGQPPATTPPDRNVRSEGFDAAYGERSQAMAENSAAFSHAACGDTPCEPREGGYPLVEQRMMAETTGLPLAQPEPDASMPGPDGAATAGRYAAVGTPAAWAPEPRPSGVE